MVRVVTQSGQSKNCYIHAIRVHNFSIGLLQLFGQVNVYGLDACVVCKGVFAKLATYTRLLISTERYLRIEAVVIVHPNSSSMQSVCSGDGTGYISREDRGSQTVLIK